MSYSFNEFQDRLIGEEDYDFLNLISHREINFYSFSTIDELLDSPNDFFEGSGWPWNLSFKEYNESLVNPQTLLINKASLVNDYLGISDVYGVKTLSVVKLPPMHISSIHDYFNSFEKVLTLSDSESLNSLQIITSKDNFPELFSFVESSFEIYAQPYRLTDYSISNKYGIIGPLLRPMKVYIHDGMNDDDDDGGLSVENPVSDPVIA